MFKYSFFLLIFFPFDFFAQQIQVIDGDSVYFYVDTQTSSAMSWGGASYNGTAHVGTNTLAYSQSNGILNTQTIVSALGAGNYPASRCSNLFLDNKDDWYLPSGDESKIVYNALNSLALIPEGWYWTSSDENGSPYTSFFTFDVSAWKKWFGGGEGDIYELAFKIDNNSSFCIRKEVKSNSVSKLNLENKNLGFKYYDLLGKETVKIFNTILIKKYDDGNFEKVFYIN